MKSIFKIFLLLVIITSCKTREKEVSKNETKSETFSKSEIKIERKTIDFVFNKSLFTRDFSYRSSAEETSKTETKNVEIIKEYYENGTLKKEMQRNFSELAETTKKAISELEEKFTKEKENSRYWENSSNHYYQLLEQEKTKTKDYAMQLKAKESFAWQLFAIGLFLGWLLLPRLFQWLFSWVKRFQPYIALVEFLNRKR